MSDSHTFESRMKELDEIVQKMEDSQLSLSDMMAAHQRGMTLAKECENLLKQAQQQLETYQDNSHEQDATTLPSSD